MAEYRIHMSNGDVIETSNFDTIVGLRESIKESFSGKGVFHDGLSIDYEDDDAMACINPMHVAYIVDIRDIEDSKKEIGNANQ